MQLVAAFTFRCEVSSFVSLRIKDDFSTYSAGVKSYLVVYGLGGISAEAKDLLQFILSFCRGQEYMFPMAGK